MHRYFSFDFFFVSRFDGLLFGSSVLVVSITTYQTLISNEHFHTHKIARKTERNGNYSLSMWKWEEKVNSFKTKNRLRTFGQLDYEWMSNAIDVWPFRVLAKGNFVTADCVTPAVCDNDILIWISVPMNFTEVSLLQFANSGHFVSSFKFLWQFSTFLFHFLFLHKFSVLFVICTIHHL